MTKRTKRYGKKGGGQVPALQKYGFENGASSPHENAMLRQKQAAAEQNSLNKQHAGGKRRRYRRSRRRLRGGYQYKQLGGRIVVPQSENAAPSAGPVDGNSLAVGGAENLTQNKENATTDNVNAPAKVTTVAGGGRKKRRRTKKHRKSRGKYGYNQRGCSRNGKRKSRRRTKRRNSKRFIVGGKRRRSRGKGGYATQLWGCFS